LEYSLWFDLILTGLQSVNAPIPLGGTSNHFRKSVLQKMGGWDAFNVTEDCDLGMRLSKAGYKTAILDSTTYEEANSDLKNWVNQRTRWIQGYIQTLLVHMRDMKSFWVSGNKSHLPWFLIIVGGKVLSLYINPLMWIITISYFAFHSVAGSFIESLYPSIIFYMAILSLTVGNFIYLYNYMIGCESGRRHRPRWCWCH
jgi:cellulose synthase/poly-beta-1,6-N-acetylglucosamine synthase-like glycosyltransferase